MERGRIYFWDFFGPRAEGTARHFVEHLDQFLERESRLEREGFLGCETGAGSRGPGHAAAWCRVPPDAEPEIHRGIQKALRPRRFEDPEEDPPANDGEEEA